MTSFCLLYYFILNFINFFIVPAAMDQLIFDNPLTSRTTIGVRDNGRGGVRYRAWKVDDADVLLQRMGGLNLPINPAGPLL